MLSVSGRTAAYVKPLDKKKKTIVIPATVRTNGVKYKITAIADRAFKGNKDVTKVKIGSGITKIGKNVFYGCRNLKTVTIGKNVVEARIKVPAAKREAYKKLFRAKGVSGRNQVIK